MRVSPRQYQETFASSEIGVEVLSQLHSMEADAGYITKGTYAPSMGGDVSFVMKHFTYLSLNQNVKPREYMANLRLKTRSRILT